MKYISTRNENACVSASEAIVMGISPEGGLFVPVSKPQFSLEQIKKIASMNYNDRAFAVLKPFLTEFSDDEIRNCIEKAYNKTTFDTEKIAPLIALDDNLSVLELWHGPTYAFKDMALQLLPSLMVKSTEKTGQEGDLVILVATSGDTGKAALEGFKDIDKTRVIVFYPDEGVSDIQRLQMLTQEGNNVDVVSVSGNFDDAQNGVKALFVDIGYENILQQNNYRFTSANSINWGRLLPQIVYYFSSYMDLMNEGRINLGEKINFVVPTGNFGNILAAYYACEMGLPINKLICASNSNNVLTDFINIGEYDRKREFKKTISPSMDILISSNLERLLFELCDLDSNRINQWMLELKESGRYTVDKESRRKLQELFWGGSATDDETKRTIRDVFDKYSYVMDTHTAVGKYVHDKYVETSSDTTATVIVSTASPFKFNTSVASALLKVGEIDGKNDFDLLEVLAGHTGWEVPEGLKTLKNKPINHKRKCSPKDMKDTVSSILKI